MYVMRLLISRAFINSKRQNAAKADIQAETISPDEMRAESVGSSITKPEASFY